MINKITLSGHTFYRNFNISNQKYLKYDRDLHSTRVKTLTGIKNIFKSMCREDEFEASQQF